MLSTTMITIATRIKRTPASYLQVIQQLLDLKG